MLVQKISNYEKIITVIFKIQYDLIRQSKDSKGRGYKHFDNLFLNLNSLS